MRIRMSEKCACHYGKKSSADRWRNGVESRKEKLIQALASEIQIVDTVLFGTDCTYARMEELASTQKNVVQT